MEASEGPTAPASGTSSDDIPSFEELAADPEIAALLDFEPVPRKRNVEGGWTPELQREFIARLAMHGSPGRACDEMGKTLTGMMKMYRSPLAASFRAAWHDAVELAKRRRAERAPAGPAARAKAPTIDHRFKSSPPLDGEGQGWGDAPSQPGQVVNEFGEWEDADSYARRADDAMDSIRRKLLNARRLYLQEIAPSPGKRAAFEILTEYEVDWDKAEKLEAQPDEPWNRANQRQPDMILTADSGWSFGHIGYGEDKKAELQEAINRHRIENGQEPIDWASESTESSDPPLDGEDE